MDRRTVRTRAALRAAVLDLAAQQDIGDVSVVGVARRAGINRATFFDHATSPAALLVAVLAEELDEIRSRLLDPDAAGAAATTPNALDVVDQVSRAVAEHVERHAAVYERALVGGDEHERPGSSSPVDESSSPSGATLSAPLSTLLADHFTRTLETFLARHPWLRPPAALRPTAPGVAPRETGHLAPGRPGAQTSEPAGASAVVGDAAEAREVRAYARYVALGSVGALETWLALPTPRDPDFFPRVACAALPAWWTATPPGPASA